MEQLYQISEWKKGFENSHLYTDDVKMFLSNFFSFGKYPKESLGSRAKFIKDRIWGNVQVDEITVQLINMPAFQRLRNVQLIPQSSHIYPFSRSTYFEHSLGAYHVVTDLIKSCSNRSSQYGVFSKEEYVLTCHAALLSEISAGLIYTLIKEGYISEKSLRSLTIAGFPIIEIESKFRNADCHLYLDKRFSERTILPRLLSCFLILSEPFQVYYDNLDLFEDYEDEISPSIKLCSAMLGIPFSKSSLMIYDLLHGDFGCKSIDRIYRDSDSCGIHIPLDYQRVQSAITFEKRDIEGAEGVYNFDVLEEFDREPYFFLVDDFDPFNIREFAISKQLTNWRIQTHPWLLLFYERISTMLDRAILEKSHPEYSQVTDLIYDWHGSDMHLLDSLQSVAQTNQDEKDNLLSRQHYRRSLAISSSTLSNEFPDALKESSLDAEIDEFWKDVKGFLFKSINEKLSSPEEKHKICVRIVEKSIELNDCFLFGTKYSQEGILDGVFAVPDKSLDSDKIKIQLITHRGKGRSNLKTVSGGFSWESEDRSENTIFIYSPKEWTCIVAIAAQIVFYEDFEACSLVHNFSSGNKLYGKQLGESPDLLLRPVIDHALSAKICGLSNEDVQGVMKILSKIGYYDTHPRLYKFDLEAKHKKLSSLAKKLSSYNGDEGYSVTTKSLQQFLVQIPPTLRQNAISLIESIKVLDRATLQRAFTNHFKVIEEGINSENVFYIPLSESSGKSIKGIVNFKSLSGESLHGIREASDRIESDRDSVVIYDDNIVSGTQAASSIKFWLGESSEKTEKNISYIKLNESQIIKLRSANLIFAFHVATDIGFKKIESCLVSAGFDMRKVKFVSTCKLEEMRGSHVINDALRDELALIGEQVLTKKYQKDGMPDAKEKAANRRLGFDNMEAIYVTMFNVPTACYTALWCPGTVIRQGREEPWIPLLIRNSHKNLVVIG